MSSDISRPSTPPSEQTPLLATHDSESPAAEQSQPQGDSSAASLLRSFQASGKKGARRWPSILALVLLCLAVLLIIIFAFFAPAVVEEYAMQAMDFEPTSLSIDNFTSTGVRARVHGNFVIDASKVERKLVRDLGRFGTWIAREAESGESEVEVSLPEYGNVVLGIAHVPSVKVDIRNGHTTHVDFLSDLEPGDIQGVKRIVNDWIDGRLGQLRILGKARVPLKSGLFSLGTQTVAKELFFAKKDIPSVPQYRVHRLNFREVEIPSGRGMAADVSLVVHNDYPVEFQVPPLGFSILVENCSPEDPYIMVADALTQDLNIKPKQDVELNITGVVRQLPSALTQVCPGSHYSPLDVLLGSYIHGNDTIIYARGSESRSKDTPRWIVDLISSITVPAPFPGYTFGPLIRNFSLTETHFGLPDPLAAPNTPGASPRISANVKALVALPEEMNFNISVSRIRADADVFYNSDKLGKLDLGRWQHANSTRLELYHGFKSPSLAVESAVKNVPLYIEDEDVFTDVLQALLFGGGRPVLLTIKADVDMQLETAPGEFTVRKIPVEGEVPVNPISRGGLRGPSFNPKVGNLQIIETGKGSLTLTANVNMTNPTEYSATVPYVDINILTNGTDLGHVTARNLSIMPGENENMLVTAVWDPYTAGGEEAAVVGRELLSQYISGYNTTLTLQTHEGSIPAQPALGRALSKFSVDMPTPSLRRNDSPSDDPDDPDDPDKHGKEGPHFIEDATMHLLTSTATFTLMSPLKSSIIYVTYINATAFYKSDVVGHIDYDLPFAVPPVDDDGEGIATPRLPVDWSLGSVGYEAVRKALGGELKLSARAVVGLRLGKWEERIWFEGKGIGAKVRI